MSSDPNQMLLGAGRSASFPTVGTVIGGTVIAEPVVRERTDMGTGEVLRYKDGNPKLQVVIKVQTTLSEDADDDGIRSFYIKDQMRAAVGKAMQAAKAKKIEIDGVLEIACVREVPSAQRGFHPQKIYEARYTPPAASAATNFFAAPQPAPQPAHQPAPQPAAPASTLESMRAFQNQAMAQQPPF